MAQTRQCKQSLKCHYAQVFLNTKLNFLNNIFIHEHLYIILNFFDNITAMRIRMQKYRHRKKFHNNYNFEYNICRCVYFVKLPPDTWPPWRQFGWRQCDLRPFGLAYWHTGIQPWISPAGNWGPTHHAPGAVGPQSAVFVPWRTVHDPVLPAGGTGQPAGQVLIQEPTWRIWGQDVHGGLAFYSQVQRSLPKAASTKALQWK